MTFDSLVTPQKTLVKTIFTPSAPVKRPRDDCAKATDFPFIYLDFDVSDLETTPEKNIIKEVECPRAPSKKNRVHTREVKPIPVFFSFH